MLETVASAATTKINDSNNNNNFDGNSKSGYEKWMSQLTAVQAVANISLKKNSGLNGVLAHDMRVRCSNHWAMKQFMVGRSTVELYQCVIII